MGSSKADDEEGLTPRIEQSARTPKGLKSAFGSIGNLFAKKEKEEKPANGGWFGNSESLKSSKKDPSPRVGPAPEVPQAPPPKKLPPLKAPPPPGEAASREPSWNNGEAPSASRFMDALKETKAAVSDAEAEKARKAKE